MSEAKEALQTQLLELLASEGYQPMRRSEIAQRFRLDSADRRTLRYVIRTLESEGKVVLLRKNRIALPSHGENVVGTLSVHHKGFGFVSLDDGQGVDGEIFVPADGMGSARHSDRVQLRIFESTAPPGRLPASAEISSKVYEGRVMQVLKRGFTEVVGLLQRPSTGWRLIPDNGRIEEVPITGCADHIALVKNHKVVVELDEPEFPGAPLRGRVVEDLGAMDEPGVDMLSVMRMYDLEQAFPAEVMKAVEGFGQSTIEAISEQREDLREWVTFTIDPVDAKDFDDALSLRRLESGLWQIGVHIADVSAFVPQDSVIDIEAQRRATSVYLADRVVTMLPENLTNELCSLRPDQDRLAHSVLIEVDDEGELRSYDTCKSVIHSRARLHYGQAQAFLDEQKTDGIPRDVQESLKDLFNLTGMLRKKRFASGSMVFEGAEIKCVLDEDGKVARVEKRTSREANQLVEECMLLANKVVAVTLNGHELTNGIYRIHEAPREKQWQSMAEELQLLGIHEPPETREDINAILGEELPEHLVFPVTVAILRNLNRAVYSEKLDEHFGLAFEMYSHFTSPIRRYPDLMAHRMLEAIESNELPPYSFGQVKEIARHSSEREQMAEEAEKLSVQIKLITYYADLLWRGETGPLKGCVTGMTPKGLIVELTDTLQRGMVAFQDIDGDYFEVNRSSTIAHGSRTGREFRLGTKVNVRLARVDTRNQRIDFALADGGAGKKNKRSGRGKKQGKGGRGGPQQRRRQRRR